MKCLLFLVVPFCIFGSTLTRSLEEAYNNPRHPLLQEYGKIYLKAGPATTIYAKTRLRPALGLSYRSYKTYFSNLDALDITFSYSYNNVENEKRSFSIGEIFLPKVMGIKYKNPASDASVYYGIGAGLYSSWQKETHSKSSSLLSSRDDDLYSIDSFFFFGSTLSAVLGYEMYRSSEISSGVQLEANTPLVSFSKASKGKASPLSIEISYIAGF